MPRLEFIQAAAAEVGLPCCIAPAEVCEPCVYKLVLFGSNTARVFQNLGVLQERDAMCQQLLAHRLSGTGCLLIPDLFVRFEELQQFADPSAALGLLPVAMRVHRLERMRIADAIPATMFAERRETFGPHNAALGLTPDVDVTGTPCQDWSPIGARLGLFGPNWPIFRAWQLWCQSAEPKILVHENVPEFPVHVLFLFFAERYNIFLLEVDPVHTGCYALARRRSYCVMYHKDQTVVQRNPTDVFHWLSTHVQSMVSCLSPDDFFQASDDELQTAVQLLAPQRGIAWEHALLDWTLLLTPGEQVRLQGYLQFLGLHMGFCFLAFVVAPRVPSLRSLCVLIPQGFGKAPLGMTPAIVVGRS